MISGRVEDTMPCDEVREWLGPYLDGELAADQGARVREHVTACAACRAELDDFRTLAASLAPHGAPTVPQGLWSSIEKRLDTEKTTVKPQQRPWHRFPIGVRFATAAAIALLLGGIWFGLFSLQRSASASEVDFSVLLDTLPFDVDAAFERFVKQHKGQRSTPEHAKRLASSLNFAVPAELHGGFLLKDVFVLRIGSQRGVAARYDRQGEFLAAIFHPPVRKEEFGSHRDYECVVGQHRGHAVSVDGWTMVHVTDPTTCHCVLSRLDQSHLPPILKAVAPELTETTDHAHGSESNHP